MVSWCDLCAVSQSAKQTVSVIAKCHHDDDDAESSAAGESATTPAVRNALIAPSTSSPAMRCHFSLVSWSARAAAPASPTLSYSKREMSRLMSVYSSLVTSFFRYRGFKTAVTIRCNSALVEYESVGGREGDESLDRGGLLRPAARCVSLRRPTRSSSAGEYGEYVGEPWSGSTGDLGRVRLRGGGVVMPARGCW